MLTAKTGWPPSHISKKMSVQTLYPVGEWSKLIRYLRNNGKVIEDSLSPFHFHTTTKSQGGHWEMGWVIEKTDDPKRTVVYTLTSWDNFLLVNNLFLVNEHGACREPGMLLNTFALGVSRMPLDELAGWVNECMGEINDEDEPFAWDCVETSTPTLKADEVESRLRNWTQHTDRLSHGGGVKIVCGNQETTFRLPTTAPPARMCHNCGWGNKHSFRCAACKKAFYCNRACQKAHWAKHKAQCV